jgi:hypothetical protein
MTKNKQNVKNQKIWVKRAVEDQSGEIYCLVTNGKKEHYISLTAMVKSPSGVLEELALAGIPVIEHSLLTDLKKQLQNHPLPSPAIVASQPGWVSYNLFVHPDGEVKKGEIIVAFIPDPAYGKSGTLEEWRRECEPIIKGQTLLEFGLCYSFSALLLEKTKPTPQNPIVEIYGEREAGKSLFGLFIGSVHGGDLTTGVGIGRTVDGTSLGFKQVQRATSDSLLFLDETNIIDKNVESNLRLFFDHTSRDERLRFGSVQRRKSIRNTLLITGNQRLVDRVKASSVILAAAQSRCLSVNVGKSIDGRPRETEAEKIEWFVNIINVSNKYFGTPSRVFVEKMILNCEKNSDVFTQNISLIMNKFIDKMPDAPHLPNRIKLTIALSFVAGWYAYKWKIWPSTKKNLFKVCSKIYFDASKQASIDHKMQSSSVRKLVTAIKLQNDKIKLIKKDSGKASPPYALAYRVDKSSGFTNFYLSKEFVDNYLRLTVHDLKEIKKQGILKGEGVRSTRLMNKSPKFIPLEGRIYEIKLPTSIVQ